MIDSSNQQPTNGNRFRGSFLKSRRFRLILIALAIVLLPFVFFRLTSEARKLVRCDYPEVEVDSTGQKFDSSASSILRVATWNIAHGRGAGDSNWEQGGDEKRNRVDQISEQIRAFDADVVILNEVDFSATWSGGNDQARQIALKAGYPFCIKQANLDFGFLYGRWYFGNVILSRFPVSDAKVVPLKPLNEWESWLVGNKRGLSCIVELPGNRKISVVGLHLESRGEAIRVKQIDDVARHLGQLPSPIIVAGDLNTTPSNFPNSRSDGDGINAFDKLIRQTQFSYKPDDIEDSADSTSALMTYSTLDPKSIIDWVLFSHELKLNDQQTINTQLSDHRPVIATIELKQ